MNVLSPYIDPTQFTSVPFGSHSHYAQPHRAYSVMRPAKAFLDGVGFYCSGATDVAALAAAGFRNARIEVGWDTVSWDETEITGAASLTSLLRLCQSNRVRPLILLNANEGAPCPFTYVNYTVQNAVAINDATITFTTAVGLTLGYSGLTNTEGYRACAPVFTAISGNVVTLSQPCPVAFTAGQVIQISTLKYQPFGVVGSASYNATLAGWLRYVGIVGALCLSVLGAGGWDMEVWNELTFGSAFLDGVNYGLPSSSGSMISLLTTATGEYCAANPAVFDGVTLSDGMSNTTPFSSAQREDSRIGAIDKHPYVGRATYPTQNSATRTLNALGQADATGIPTYTALLPEYYGTMLSTECVLRDASPFADDSFNYSGDHGMNVRPGNPCPVLITEYAMDSSDGADAATIDKAFERAMVFWLGVGVKRLYWFKDSTITANQMAWVSKVVNLLASDLESVSASALLSSLSETHGHTQFTGDGTAAHPDLYNRECFAFFPWQVSASRIVAAYYVITRDVAVDLVEEDYTLNVSGLAGSTFSVYDPATDSTTPLACRSLSITLPCVDRPRFLIIDLPTSAQIIAASRDLGVLSQLAAAWRQRQI